MLFSDIQSGAFDEYHKTLGEFVSKFSEVEANLISALWHFAGVQRPIAQAVLTGTKVEGAISFINRVADAKHWRKSRRASFKEFSDQFGLINKLRNDILHNGSNWTASQTWTVTNRFFAHAPSKIRTYPVSADLLKRAKSDLELIETKLILFTWGYAMKPKTKRDFKESALHPWQYKPPLGFESGQTNQKTPHKQSNRPKASRGSRWRDAAKKRDS
jgi:hypothetical protein